MDFQPFLISCFKSHAVPSRCGTLIFPHGRLFDNDLRLSRQNREPGQEAAEVVSREHSLHLLQRKTTTFKAGPYPSTNPTTDEVGRSLAQGTLNHSKLRR